MVTTRVQPEPRIVYLMVTGTTPTLVADVASSLVVALRHFDIEMRQTEAKDRRGFLEQRVTEARSELERSERAMELFLESNGRVDAPRLKYQQARLQRDIELRNQLYMTLANQLETARIDEVNERPRISIIDNAIEPVRPRSSLLPVFALAGLVLGVAIAAMPRLRRTIGLSTRSTSAPPSALSSAIPGR
jgi:tyrosine-protein kinase Etk/Wzc